MVLGVLSRFWRWLRGAALPDGNALVPPREIPEGLESGSAVRFDVYARPLLDDQDLPLKSPIADEVAEAEMIVRGWIDKFDRDHDPAFSPELMERWVDL